MRLDLLNWHPRKTNFPEEMEDVRVGRKVHMGNGKSSLEPGKDAHDIGGVSDGLDWGGAGIGKPSERPDR